MYDHEYWTTEQIITKKKGLSLPFVIGAVALGVLLGFTLGLTANSLGGERGTSLGLFDEGVVTSLFESASPAVVELLISRESAGVRLPGGGTGSGFLVDDEGHLITNHHVVAGAAEITVNFFDGRSLKATLLGTSPADDLALLQVNADEIADIAPLVLADSNEVMPGQMAIAIGSPFQQFNSLSVGVVSGTGRGTTSIIQRPIPDMIQTDAALNPGNSGGPLLNSKGEVIGVTSSVRVGAIQGLDGFRIGFAIPSNTVRGLLPELVKPQEVRRPWLGIAGASVGGDLSESGGLLVGIYVTRVFRASPAERAGLVPFQSFGGAGSGDVITAVDGQPVTSVEDMVSYFNELKPGAAVTLSIFRGGEAIEVDVTLDEWPDT